MLRKAFAFWVGGVFCHVQIKLLVLPLHGFHKVPQLDNLVGQNSQLNIRVAKFVLIFLHNCNYANFHNVIVAPF